MLDPQKERQPEYCIKHPYVVYLKTHVRFNAFEKPFERVASIHVEPLSDIIYPVPSTIQKLQIDVTYTCMFYQVCHGYTVCYQIDQYRPTR